MVLYKDRRLFKRYKQKTDFYVTIDGNYYKAATVDFAVAVELFGQAVYIDSGTGEYHYYLSLAYGRLKRFRDAQKAISKALELDPDNVNYIAENGVIYLGLEFHLRAKSVFEKALKLDPHNKKAKEGLSRIKTGEAKIDWV